MKRLLLIALLCASQALGQTAGLLVPGKFQAWVANGSAVLANGWVCSYTTGTTTPLSTYTDQTGGTPNANPTHLDATGRGNIWLLIGSTYTIKIYASGTGNSCNGTTVGTLIWNADGQSANNAATSDNYQHGNLQVDSTKGIFWNGLAGNAPSVVAKSSSNTVDLTEGTGGFRILTNAGAVNWAITDAGVISSASPLPATSGGTGLASGTSGGVPYFSSTTIIASSAALSMNNLVVGGGPGVAPTTPGYLGSDGVSVINLGSGGAGGAGGVGFLNLTSGKILLSPPTGALGTPTVTLPALTGSLGTGYSCGNALAAAGTCANTAQAGTFHMVFGSAVLAGSTSTITGISPAFTSSTSWWCVANDITTRANPVQAIPASASTLTITNTTGATDTIQYICAGN